MDVFRNRAGRQEGRTNCSKEVSQVSAKNGMGTPIKERKQMSGRDLASREFSPTSRHNARVKTRSSGVARHLREHRDG